MTQIEFLKYEEAGAGEKYLGIATINYKDQLILKLKVQNTKDGSDIFVVAPSYKTTVNGADQWENWFILERRSEEQELQNLVKSKVKAFYSQKQPAQQQSQQPVQENPWGPQTTNFNEHPRDSQHNSSYQAKGWGQPVPPSQNNLPF